MAQTQCNTAEDLIAELHLMADNVAGLRRLANRLRGDDRRCALDHVAAVDLLLRSLTDAPGMLDGEMPWWGVWAAGRTR